jgi:hypothetical protein
MTFLHASILGFLALAAIPVVLWLLFRRRKNEVQWGATYILRLTLQSKKKQNLWKQLIIISLRTILLALLVLAFARPFTRQDPAVGLADFPRGAGTLHRVILFDNSPSMNAKSGPLSRLDQARQTLASLLASARPGDTCHVIPLCPDDAKAITPIAVNVPLSASDAASFVARLEVAPRPVDFAGALRTAVRTFRDLHPDQRQLIVLSDLCRVDHEATSDYAVFGSMLESLKVRVATLNLGSHDTGNLAVEALTAGSELLFAKQPTNIYVDVMNYSDAPAEGSVLTFLVDGTAVKDIPVAAPAGFRKSFIFPVELPVGEHRLEARLSSDAFPADDSIDRFVHAAPALRVLVISPKETAEGFEKETEFLRRSLLAPPDAGFKMDAQFSTIDQLLPKDLADRDIIVLASINSLPQPFINALQSWVRRGGGLVFAVGPQTNADAFNTAFADLLPARIQPKPLREKFDEERFLTVQPSDFPLLLLREFEDTENGDIASARVYNHYQLIPPAPNAPAPRTLVSLANGDPIVLDAGFGKGRVILFTTTLNGAWTSLPVTHAYVPLLSRLFNYAAGFAAPAHNIAAGDPIIADVTGHDGDLYLTTPDAKLPKVTAADLGAKRFVRYEATQLPGKYELQDAKGATIASFSVSFTSAESDLRTLDDAHAAGYTQVLDSPIVSSTAELKQALWRDGDGRESAVYFLALVLAIFLLDAALTRMWF